MRTRLPRAERERQMLDTARALVDAFGVPENVLGDARAVAEAVTA